MVFYGKTDTGRKRENNQDVFYTHNFGDNTGFSVVCDGMGGHNSGNVASKVACEEIVRFIKENINKSLGDEEIQTVLANALISANGAVFDMASKDVSCKGMGTTAVVASVCGGRCYIAHVGDSRAYVLKDKELYQITRDHSRVQELLEQGIISKEEMRTHPDKNKITRAIGVNKTVDVDVCCLDFISGEKLLLCSDGLTNMVSDEELCEVLVDNEAKQACEMLVEQANIAGGTDNITVVVIE